MAQRQLACKVVDLRRYTPESDGYGMPLDGAHKVGVQAYVERYRGITEARKKLMREIEILGKLNHVRTHSFSLSACAYLLSQILLLSSKHSVRLILCKLIIHNSALGG